MELLIISTSKPLSFQYSERNDERTFWKGFTDLLDVTDITSDMYGQVKHKAQTLRGGVSRIVPAVKADQPMHLMQHVRLPKVEYFQSRSRASKIEMELPNAFADLNKEAGSEEDMLLSSSQRST